MKYLLILSLLFSATLFADEFEDEFAEESASTGSSAASERSDFEFNGAIEFEQGANFVDSGALYDNKQTWTMANRKFRLKTMKTNDNGGLFAKIDIVRDDVTGESFIDFRELRLQYKLASWLDMSLGKQVSTWGVADMLFINDLFPKNWVANFRGQDMEYLKDSSTSLRLTSYFGAVTWDVVYTPQFAPDTTPTGCYLSTYNPNEGTIISNGSTDDNLCGSRSNYGGSSVTNHVDDGEIAMSLKKTLLGQELSLYYYNGFYKNPRSMYLDNGKLKPLYPKLESFGFSSEGQVGPGIFTLEYGFYDSKDDTDTSLLIENSLHKYLVGYKVDFNANLTMGFQIYREYMTDYDKYKDLYATVSDVSAKKENQNTYTLRITYKAMQETLWFNLFTYFRPDDKDSFTKIDISKKLDNNFTVVTGVNIFTGDSELKGREFASLKDSDNVFVRFKYDL